MSVHSLTVPLLVGNSVPTSEVEGVVLGAVDSALVEIAPAYDFQRADGKVNWAVPRPFKTNAESLTVPGLEDSDTVGDPVTWLIKITFKGRGNTSVVRTALFQIPEAAGPDISYPTDVTLVDIVLPPEYGPTWAEQAEAAKDAAEVAQLAAESAAAAAAAAATDAARLQAIIYSS